MINDDCLEKLMKTIETNIKKTVEEANKKQTNDIKGYIKLEIEELNRKFEEKLKKTNDENEIKYNQLKSKYDKLEKELKKNNVIIFGLQHHEKNLTDFVINTLNNHLQLTLTTNDIDRVYKIGRNPQNKPIIVKFTTYLAKQTVLRNCKKLKGTSISIGEQLSDDEQQENKILREHLKVARANNQRATIVNNKLIINGQKYNAHDLEAKEDADSENNEESENDVHQTNSGMPGKTEKQIKKKETEIIASTNTSKILSEPNKKKNKPTDETVRMRPSTRRINSVN